MPSSMTHGPMNDCARPDGYVATYVHAGPNERLGADARIVHADGSIAIVVPVGEDSSVASQTGAPAAPRAE